MDLLDILRWFTKISDWLALIAAAAMGFLAGLFVPAGSWSIFASMLISYHLFLDWLVLTSEKKIEMVRPFSYPATLHFASIVVIGSLGTARFIVPHFELFCGGVAVLALLSVIGCSKPPKQAFRASSRQLGT